MDTNKIQQLIITELKTITGIPFIVEPNKAYTPSVGTPYIRTRFTAGEPVAQTIGFNRVMRASGTFTADVWIPVNTGYNSKADDIVKHFNKPENYWLDYSDNFKLQIYSSWRGNDFTDDKGTWTRNTAILRWYLSYPAE